MNAKHTPGPWVVSGGGAEVRSQNGALIATTEHWLVRQDQATAKANIRLIAAAPEMLAVLQLIISKDLLPFLGAEGEEMLKAAIAKATGGAE